MKLPALPFLLLALSACPRQPSAQQAIFLANPSFEGNPRYGSTPGGWQSCAFNEESPPDLHPVPGGTFQVAQEPHDGETYLGMVVRENASTEAVGQKLPQPLQAGQCYSLSLYLCRSEHLFSLGRLSGQSDDFNTPAVLRIWGGRSPCGKKALLATSPAIAHLDWKKYTFRFDAPDSLTHLSFEAWFVESASAAYNGNLLLDNLSPILPIDCRTFEPLVNPDTLRIPPYRFQKTLDSGTSLNVTFPRDRWDYHLLFKAVTDPRDLPALLEENCPRIAFSPGSAKWADFEAIGLMEVAFNMKNYRRFKLLVALNDAGEKLTAKRMKAVKKALRRAGLPKEQFQILLDPSAETGEGWLCGQGEIWLRLEDRVDEG